MQDFTIPTERIEWGREKQHGFEVRGLSFEDLKQLFMAYGKDVDKIFTFVEGAQRGSKDLDIKEFGAELITKTPQVAAQLIALAADMPDRAKMERIPFPVQVKALEAIYNLTIEETGGLTDFLELVLRLIQSVRQKIPSMNLQANLPL